MTYGLIGAVALALALGAGSAPEAPNQQGALALIAQAPLGRIALAVTALGLLAYAAWKLVQAVRGRGPEGGGGPKLWDRIANAAGGIVYLIFFTVAVRVLLGPATSDSSEPRHTAAGVLGWPGGQVLVGIAGAGLIAISVYQVLDAVRGKFTDETKIEEMSEAVQRAYVFLGLVGLVVRALVFGVVGYFLLRTAIEFNAKSAVGLDGALAAVHGEPYGPLLLGLVAAGLLTFSAFSFMEARYRLL